MGKMQPVVNLTSPPMEQLYDILIMIALSIIMSQFRNIIEQSMLMRYYTFWQHNVSLVPPEWILQFEESILVAYAKIDKYTPRNWRMYNEGKDSGYTDAYNQGHLEGHDNHWDEAKEYYQKIFERELREAKQQWKEEGANNEYSEEIAEEYEESYVDDEWSAYGQKDEDSKQTESREWFDQPDDELRDAIKRDLKNRRKELREGCSNADYEIIAVRRLRCHF
jgi:hypothetical protein